MPYVRHTTIPEAAFSSSPDLDGLQGEELWILFNDEGQVVIVSDNRSKVFFFATENEIPISRLH